MPEEIGYFDQATKHWIHNRLNLSDVWDKIESGARVDQWCVCNASAVAKKSNGNQASLDNENECDRKKQKLTHAWALVEEHEQKLREEHGDKYSHFQYKLWAEPVPCIVIQMNLLLHS